MADTILYAPTVDYDASGHSPGDTIYISAGTYTQFNIHGARGADGNPVVITNLGGQVELAASSYNDANFQDNQWIRIRGDGDVGYTYGFLSHMRFLAYDDSTGLIIHHIEFDNPAPGGSRIGISAKTGAGDIIDFNDVEIHHCWIYGASEAIYIGDSYWDTNHYDMARVEIHHNIIDDCYDGIQVGSVVSGLSVHHNIVIDINSSVSGPYDAGIMINNGCGTTSPGEIYDNWIEDCEEWGIYHGGGALDIYCNIILNTGNAVASRDAIATYCGSYTTNIYNNTILTAGQFGGGYGIDVGGSSVDVYAYNNIILDCGTAPIDPASCPLGNFHHNHTDNDGYTIATYGFINYLTDDYHLSSGCDGIAAGTSSGAPADDYDEVSFSAPPAIGAYEYVGAIGSAGFIDLSSIDGFFPVAAVATTPSPATPQAEQAVRVLVADRTGRILAEVEPQLGPVSWRLNDVGRATLTFAKTDPKAIEDYLRFGNRLLIQFANGLPNWGGVIDPPRKWDQKSIQITAYSGEYLLGFRQTDRGRYFDGATVGYVFQQLIQEANAVSPMGVTIGGVWGGGSTHSPEYHFDNLLKIIQESLTERLSTADFAVLATETSGYVVFTAHLYERRGSDKPGVVLLEDHNLAAIDLNEQGPMVNCWNIIGQGTTWGDERSVAYAEDTDSIATHDRREDSAVHADTATQATLDETADNKLSESSWPRNVLTLDAADLAPARFADYDVGDSVRVLLHSYGFGGYDGQVRVLTREYDPAKGTCALVVQET